VTEWLLDTNILSELRRPKPEPKVHTFIATQPLERLYVSTVTLAEIRFGIESGADPARRAALYDWLAQKIRPMCERRRSGCRHERATMHDGYNFRQDGHVCPPDLSAASDNDMKL
jgi:predicted nucleic acid-binding protein